MTNSESRIAELEAELQLQMQRNEPRQIIWLDDDGVNVRFYRGVELRYDDGQEEFFTKIDRIVKLTMCAQDTIELAAMLMEYGRLQLKIEMEKYDS